MPRPRPFLELRIGGVRVTVQHRPHRLIVAAGTLAGALSGLAAVLYR